MHASRIRSSLPACLTARPPRETRKYWYLLRSPEYDLVQLWLYSDAVAVNQISNTPWPTSCGSLDGSGPCQGQYLVR